MANQMIALQARAPQQSSVLGPAIQQGAQMLNMMRQQEAAERQAASAEQQMKLAQARETREASAADIELAGKKIDYYTKLAGQTLNSQGYTVLLDKLDKDAPDIAAAFRANLPPEKFDRNLLLQMVGSIGDNFNATYGPLETEVVQADDGTFMVVRTGGFGKPGVFEMEQFNLKPSGGAPAAAAPRASAPAGMPESVGARATRGAFTTPQDLMKQGVNPRSIPSGNPLQPMSMTQGDAQPDLAGIVQNMMDTGVVSQADFDAMRAAAPGKDAQLAEILRSNNIKIMPSEPSGGLRSAVYRPEEGAPEFQQTQSMEDYVGTGRAARGKSPMQSPLPGSAQVPIPRVRAEAQAQRETPEEASARTTATERAKIAVEREKSLPAKRQVSTIVKKIRDAYETLNKAEAIPSSKRGAAANVWDYLAVSTPGREIQRAFGTETSKSLTDITASRKLLATAIKNATGMSAQEMNSNVELQLMLDALTDPTQGYEGAISVLDTIEDLYGAKNGSPASNAKAGKKIVRTGVANGRRVVQYSDGSVEYAN